MTDADHTPRTDDLVERNRVAAQHFAHRELAAPPALHIAVVACMDARMDIHEILGIDNGDAHIIRNAGGVITDDVIRSLCLSQIALGTREIVLVHHTRCGVAGLDEDAWRADLAAEVNATPEWSFSGFADPYDDVRTSIAALRASPFVPHTDHVRGFVYDVDTGLLDEVD